MVVRFKVRVLFHVFGSSIGALMCAQQRPRTHPTATLIRGRQFQGAVLCVAVHLHIVFFFLSFNNLRLKTHMHDVLLSAFNHRVQELVIKSAHYWRADRLRPFPELRCVQFAYLFMSACCIKLVMSAHYWHAERLRPFPELRCVWFLTHLCVFRAVILIANF